MGKSIFIILLLLSTFGHAQIKSVVIDSKTKEKIPFVNIWIENKGIGTTSNEKGEFVLTTNKTQNIIFSAIGYETLNIKSTSIKNIVKLKPKVTVISEITVTSKKITKERTIGKFKKSEINSSFSCGKKPFIMARFFEYKSDYDKTPYLKTLKLLTKTKNQKSKFNIRFYTINKEGKPGDYIYNKNITVVTKKGKKIVEINLSNLNIIFPKQGLFVAVEWLIIKKNRHEYKYTMEGSRKKLNGINYEPSVGTILSETPQNTWFFNKGKWWKMPKIKSVFKKLDGKYNLIAMELILNN